MIQALAEAIAAMLFFCSVCRCVALWRRLEQLTEDHAPQSHHSFESGLELQRAWYRFCAGVHFVWISIGFLLLFALRE